MSDITLFIAGCLAGSAGTFGVLIFSFALYSHLGKNFHQASLLKSFFKRQSEGEKALDDIFDEGPVEDALPGAHPGRRPIRRPIIASDERDQALENTR
jgi:hypothetical protein